MRPAAKLAALVLAAGCSSRAPGFKPLLPLGEATVIETTLASLRRAGIGDITAVVGHRAADLLSVLAGLPVRVVVNENYSDGMFSSVLAGVKALPADADAFFLLPADIPLVSSHTVRLLARAAAKTGAAVTYPVFRGERGHPPLIAARLAPAILAWTGEGGLCGLLAQYDAAACELPVLDEGTQLDIDTADDYGLLVSRRAGRHFPSAAECDAILARLAVPAPVIGHSRAVAAMARTLAARLNLAGLALDAGLIVAAGLLHDLAKGQPDHPRRGARLLRSLGYPRVAAIIAVHHDLTIPEGPPPVPDEAAVIFLADKLVHNASIVSLDERFARSREKFADPAARAAADGRQALARRIAAAVEQISGAKLGEALGEALADASRLKGES